MSIADWTKFLYRNAYSGCSDAGAKIGQFDAASLLYDMAAYCGGQRVHTFRCYYGENERDGRQL